MSTLKKSFRFLIAAILVAAFALTVTACSKEDKKTTYAVSFVTYCDTQIDPQYVEEGKTATKPDAPTREGFTFVNWYADDACETVYDFATPVTAPITIYAKWQSKTTEEQKPSGPEDSNPTVPEDQKVTLTLDYNYDNKTEQVKILKGTAIPKDKQSPTRDGFYFEGWYTDKACTKVNLHSLTASIDKDTTLYANWSQEPVQEPDGKGIDFSKMPTGVSGGLGGADNFVFDETVNIGTVTAPVEPVQPSGNDEQYTVTFNSNGGSAVSSQSVAANGKVVLPATPEKDGNMFCGWYTDSGLNNAYDFDTAVTTPLTLYAKWATVDTRVKSVNGYNESLAVVFTESNPAGATVQYSVKGANDWKSVDSPLIRKEDNSTARVDIVGLPAGEYNVKITPSTGSEITFDEAIAVTAYDRSGYAHFNRASSEAAYNGVGAYNDDGSLKANALVIYVTDANKDTVMDEVCAANTDVPMFQIPGPDWDNKNASGIGWWLNNNQYTSSNAGSKKNKVPSNTYDSAKGGTLAFKAVNRPIVIRFIGTVTTPEGCTAYNDTKEGGGVGDNGHMARLKNLKNVTLEGIGDDAVIKGWGFHYVIGTDATDGQGTSFEVRNLTFSEYPEDAIGMEGQQANGKITAGVERCWVHNNVFLPGRCDSPAESDKKEGDGSCDFKRGQYYTLSYNYFEYCHKTNLIGSSDDSLQYNITMHHNMWYQCGSRIPLLRQANVHFYNNYILGDQTEKTTPYSHISKPSLSYVSSLRANCLMFSEANYYDGCKNYAQQKSGMAVAWNNAYASNTGDTDMTELTSRTQSVDSKCAYDGVSYTGFYAKENLFYYDKENEVSNCLLDDAIGAWERVLQCVGVNGFTTRTKMEMNKNEPKTVKAGDTVNIGKGKGELYTFKLTAPMEVQVKGGAGSGDSTPQLLDCYGRIWLEKFTGDRTVVLPAGVYFFASGQKDKESTITSVTFADTAASSEARVNAAKTTLSAIPDEIGYNSYDAIKAARDAYNALMSSEKEQITSDLYSRLTQAEAAYQSLAVKRVIARINYIGTVDETSYNKITAARKEYTALTPEKQAEVENYATLTAAEAAFAQFAAKTVNDLIKDLPDLTQASISTYETLDKVEDWFGIVKEAYEDLTEEQQEQVVGYEKVAAGYAELNKFATMIKFREALAETAVEGLTTGQGAAVKNLYDALTEAQKATLLAAERNKYEAIVAAYTELANQTKSLAFDNKEPITQDGDFWTYEGKFKDGTSSTINNVTYHNGLKLDSNGKVQFTTTAKMTLKVYYSNKSRIKLDGTTDVTGDAEGDHYVATIVIEAGTHTISKGKDGESYLYIVELSPAD